MYSKSLTKKSTENYYDNIVRLKMEILEADAILLGAGAGLSASAGLLYSGERFEKYFSDFQQKYGIRDMYSGGFYPFQSLEEHWGWWSRHIWYNRYDFGTNDVYGTLFSLVKDKDYFVMTTNVDHQFQKAGFDKKRLRYVQGDYGLFQCSVACHQKTYDNREIIEQMRKAEKDMLIPSELIPYCPVCGEPMTVNLRSDDTFVQDDGWYDAQNRYYEYVETHKSSRILYLELGVGANTPVWIKYPFWQMTYENPNATYVCLNNGEAMCPRELETRSVCINADIKAVLMDLV